jgi:hypothetical protein
MCTKFGVGTRPAGRGHGKFGATIESETELKEPKARGEPLQVLRYGMGQKQYTGRGGACWHHRRGRPGRLSQPGVPRSRTYCGTTYAPQPARGTTYVVVGTADRTE